MTTQTSFLMVTLDGGGNIPPMLSLARQLLQRGHRVQILTEPCLEATVKQAGLGFIPFEEYFTRTDRKTDIIKDWNASAFSNPALENIILGPAQTVVEQTLKVLSRHRADVLLVDVLLTPAVMAAEIMKIPAALIFHMPEYLPGSNRPPGGLGLLPGKGWTGNIRDRLLGGVFNLVLNKHLSLINGIRTKYQLEKLKNVADLFLQADLRLIMTLRNFDFPIEPPPPNVRYTAPMLDDPDWTASWTNPWPADAPLPLVVISLSTTFQNQRRAIQQAIDALEGLEVRGLVTLGLALDHEQFTTPDNVVVLQSAPHSQVFPLASLVITHGGHGTLMRSLAHGLPLICLPMGRDQNDNAALLEYHGCGIKLSRKASVQKIRQAVNRLLHDKRYRQNTARFKKEIMAEAGKNLSVMALEQLIQARHEILTKSEQHQLSDIQ